MRLKKNKRKNSHRSKRRWEFKRERRSFRFAREYDVFVFFIGTGEKSIEKPGFTKCKLNSNNFPRRTRCRVCRANAVSRMTNDNPSAFGQSFRGQTYSENLKRKQHRVHALSRIIRVTRLDVGTSRTFLEISNKHGQSLSKSSMRVKGLSTYTSCGCEYIYMYVYVYIYI